ncbi:hypothetical protein ACFS07_31690 [Undibacterium arcticum]
MSEVVFPRLPRKGWVVGMAVKKDATELAKLLQDATNDLVSSGEMAKIFLPGMAWRWLRRNIST